MIVIRPIKQKDLDVFAEFTFESLLGITNLSRNRDKLLTKVMSSETNLMADIQKPNTEEYFFVLEDLSTGRIGGICGILANSIISHEYSYNIEKVTTTSKHLSVPKEMSILRPKINQTDASEVCSLYLQPTFRHSGQGRLLSLSRFLFIAGQRQRFKKKIIAELRGFIDHGQTSPFWDGVGHHFCLLSFVEVMAQLDQDRTFVSEILPKHPIYVPLLPKEVQNVIGKTHDSSKPALNMLIQEGFTYTNEIDVIDGGPTLIANTGNVRTIKHSALAQVRLTKDDLKEEIEYIISNERTDFRSCYGKLLFTSKTDALINEEIAEGLMIKEGDTIRFVTTH
jgi:arginine N-succinyltransferase